MISNQNNLLEMTVAQMVEQLSNAYISLIKSHTPFKVFPSVMLWGPPGVGKSQGIKEVAAEISKKTNKKVVITDVRLLLFNPVDLRGIPTSNADKTLAVWLKPKIFQMDENPDIVNVLFLDEISAAPQSVQAAAYQITLDRTVGEHKLPDNCIVIAAGNRVTDRSVAYTMPKALANRLCHIEIVGNHKSWHQWAVSKGVNSIILGFLDYNPNMLMNFDASSDSLAFPTPRSWEMVSNILNHISGNINDVLPLIAGCIGDNATYKLKSWCEIYSKLPSVEEIFAGNFSAIPKRPETLYAMSAMIVAYAQEHNSDIEIKNIVNYSAQLPMEFKNHIFTDLLEIPHIRKQLSRTYAFDDWFVRTGKDWEDYGVI